MRLNRHVLGKLDVGREEASAGLSKILPQLIDKSSQGGNLLVSVGPIGLNACGILPNN